MGGGGVLKYSTYLVPFKKIVWILVVGIGT